MIEPFKLHQKLEERLGGFTIIKNHRESSTRTGVWEIKRDSNGLCYFVKSYYRQNRWHPEVFAYKNWTPSLQPWAPRLVEAIAENDIYAIVITSLGGQTLRESKYLSEEKVLGAYYEAGRLTKRLHTEFQGGFFGRPNCDGQPIEIFHHEDPVVYFRHSVSEAFDQGNKLKSFSAQEISLAEWAIERADLFKNSLPRAVSWDSSPNNWMVDEDGDFLGFIDFENMVWGFEEDQFTILFERYFPEFPQGKEAFFQGYGEEVSWERVRAACIKASLNSIVYALENKD